MAWPADWFARPDDQARGRLDGNGIIAGGVISVFLVRVLTLFRPGAVGACQQVASRLQTLATWQKGGRGRPGSVGKLQPKHIAPAGFAGIARQWCRDA